MIFKEILSKIVKKIDLSEEEMTEIITDILSGNLTEAQIGAFMGALATKGETFEELAGAAKAMRRKAKRIQVTSQSQTVIDTCGTGGDGLKTFNISTTVAFVLAGAGVTVAKHGNRSVSSQCGSADVLEALGVKLDTQPELVEEIIEKIGIGFLFAPLYHSAMKYAAKPRKELGIRSIFNMLGPLTNPAGANCQLLGVYDSRLTEMFANALKLLGAKRAFVVCGHDGLDEISVCSPTRISELLQNGSIQTYDINPKLFFGKIADLNSLKGGDAQINAQITKNILQNKDHSPNRDIVLINSGAALVLAQKAQNIKDGIELAKQIIDSGKAFEKLEQLINANN